MPRHLQQRDRSDTVIAMNRGMMRYFVRILSMSVIGAALAIYVGSCNNQTGFSGSVGNTPNGPPLASYDILGTVGTPFTATVSDARSSWTLQGNVPFSITIANNILPARIVATKTTDVPRLAFATLPVMLPWPMQSIIWSGGKVAVAVAHALLGI